MCFLFLFFDIYDFFLAYCRYCKFTSTVACIVAEFLPSTCSAVMQSVNFLRDNGMYGYLSLIILLIIMKTYFLDDDSTRLD